ncbi:protein LONG AFTER FAR-RED 3 isoform X1 [Populus alba x Populus x berolinensis]|uniref:Protein LONG AFTER FAR-RED 3 isoform X1 n=1 Tax=Populus alba x Populus x berolinensis TaxID=444605 RepID=A0AAD6R9Z5_9ROSI|nr:protein LONG AFTER FAR-RED 3 isoform X1 [Populus alba x Populus x berolinensis]
MTNLLITRVKNAYLFYALSSSSSAEYECELSEKKKEGTSTSEERHEPLHVPLRHSRSCHCRSLSEHTTARLSTKKLAADLIVKNAVIFTSDASLPVADSMAIQNGRILRVGNYSSLQDLVGGGTRELNIEGKVLVPGFIDSHVHLIPGGLQMGRVELRGVNQKEEFVRRVKEAAGNVKQGSWVLGGGWNNDLWGGELPMASWLDDFTADNPVWLTRMDGHMGLANSLALKLAEPTGLLIDAAMKLVLPLIPEVSVNERREAFLRASNLALTRGVTTIVDFGRYFPGASVEHSWEDLSDVYQWADSSGKMIIRVCLFFPMETWPRLIELIKKTGRALSDWIYLGGVKAFADGSLGSSSAFFFEPYAEEPHNYGLQVTDPESLFNMTAASDKLGLQVAIHAIGDRANEMVLDTYRSVALTNGMRDRRFRIEHAQHLAPGMPARFGEQGVVASVQPDHLLDDGDSAAKKLGVDRAQQGSYLFHSLLASNARLALGSDWPVANINPVGSIKTAIKRIPHGWKHAWMSSECLSLNDALIAHTISAAYACFLDNELGSLSPGKLADFVILSTSTLDDLAEGSVTVEATYVAGVQAYP